MLDSLVMLSGAKHLSLANETLRFAQGDRFEGNIVELLVYFYLRALRTSSNNRLGAIGLEIHASMWIASSIETRPA
jgi:hypothetical protein